MRAAVSTRYGPADVVRVIDVPEPVITPDEVLVRVAVTTVNRTDCGLRAGSPFVARAITGVPRPRATVWGTEFAGVLEVVGDRVTSFRTGDRVFGYAESRFGAHAQYLAMPADGAIAPVPPELSFEQVAPGTEASHYALTNIRAGRISRGQDVLVHGATGAIGSAAVQFLAHLGARVTATCDTAHVGLVHDLGADRVIDRSVEDFTRDAHTYDAVFDAVGKSSFGRCRRLLRPRGVYLTTDLGPHAQNPLLVLVTRFGPFRRVLLPLPRRRDGAMVRHLADLIAGGVFRPVVDRSYPLDHIVDAYRYVESGQKIGNVLITV